MLCKPVIVLVTLTACLSGCASAPTVPRDAREPTEPIDGRSVAVYDGWSGSNRDWDDLVEAAAGAEVLVIGEMHGHPTGLAAAAALWEDVLDRQTPGGAGPALSLEFFDRSTQAALDDYLLDITDEPAFREAAGRNAGNYPEGHRAMVEAAKSAGVPVLAANAPRRYTTLARENGYASLDALRHSQRALFESPGGDPGSAYRDRFFELMEAMLTSHGGEGLDEDEIAERVEGYLRAQNVWDATMAGSVVRALNGGHRPVVHVVGRFHSDHRGGLLESIWRLRPGTRIVSVSMVKNSDPDAEDWGRADFILEVGEE